MYEMYSLCYLLPSPLKFGIVHPGRHYEDTDEFRFIFKCFLSSQLGVSVMLTVGAERQVKVEVKLHG